MTTCPGQPRGPLGLSRGHRLTCPLPAGKVTRWTKWPQRGTVPSGSSQLPGHAARAYKGRGFGSAPALVCRLRGVISLSRRCNPRGSET